MAITTTIQEQYTLSRTHTFLQRVQMALQVHANFLDAGGGTPSSNELVLAKRIRTQGDSLASQFALRLVTDELIANTAPYGHVSDADLQTVVGSVFADMADAIVG